jgi:NAD(P)-dependent dehydrogenase (short-subunit alcohol dehydrogenase family)
MNMYRVLVIGGYGFFGSRLVQLLARQPNLQIIVCGRSKATAQALVQRLLPGARAQLEAQVADIDEQSFSQTLQAVRADVVVHTAGPFQGQDYRVAQACIAAQSHYIDLADGREFVEGVGILNATAERAGVLITSGASSVPALSSAVVDALAAGLHQVTSIEIGISPGNRTERGLSTVRAIMGYCGKRLPPHTDAAEVGWRKTYAHQYPAPVGRRLLSPCDVPDLVLLGPRYSGNPRVHFGAGLELKFLHRGMNVMAMLSQFGVVRNWADHANTLKRMADWFRHWGSDAGAMHVSVTGLDDAGRAMTRGWHLVATKGDGPFVPTLAAAALVRKLAAGDIPFAGARPCIGLLTMNDFLLESQGLHITMEGEP